MLADAVPYAGQTTEHRRVVLDVRGRTVVAVRAGVTRYPCATFGDVGPLVVRETVRARIGTDGRFAFTAGEPARRITVAGVLRRRTHRIAGTLRVHGSIATGQRCASATLRFRAAR
ncbi:MAG: hypothetical protein JWR63_4178 [Conexibacter sp.]|nr:hypothetical protein [Conexibacter sp.]